VEDHTVSRTYRRSPSDHDHEFIRPRRRGEERDFRCRHCKAMVGPTLYGGKHRNHCPYCLYSRHVDGRVPGDRANTCGGSMAPIGAFVRRNGEHAIIHRCLTCRFERYNRIAADDDFALVLSLPVLPARPMPVPEPASTHELTA
jgi:DNA-directed RNA polymerase subunit RPC12/RpoP